MWESNTSRNKKMIDAMGQYKTRLGETVGINQTQNDIVEKLIPPEPEMSPEDIFDAAIQSEDVYPTDGNLGLNKLNQLARMIGYRDHSYSSGSALKEMLADNSGLAEVMFEWVKSNLSEEQVEMLESYLPAIEE
jgi:hypothetical protein